MSKNGGAKLYLNFVMCRKEEEVKTFLSIYHQLGFLFVRFIFAHKKYKINNSFSNY